MKAAVVILLLSMIPLVVFGSTSEGSSFGKLAILPASTEATMTHFRVKLHFPFFVCHKNEQVTEWLNRLVWQRIAPFVGESANEINSARENTFKSEGFWPARGSIIVDAEAYKVSERVVSVVFKYYDYIPTAAHGEEMMDSFTADLESGHLMKFRDLPVGLDKIKEELTKVILSSKNASAFDLDKLKSYPFLEKNNFYLTEDSLVIYFQKHEVGSGFVGTLEFKIPYSRLGIDPETTW